MLLHPDPPAANDAAAVLAREVLALRAALEQGLPVQASEGLAWAALDAAGLAGGFREAVRAAGGPTAVLQRRAVAAFSTPRQRTRVLNPEAIAVRLEMLLPWVEQGVTFVADDARLRRFASHPVCAFYGFGRALPAPERPVVAIVGSRTAGPRYLARTAALAASLAGQGAVIVSGGAGGIDTAAQQGARAVDGDVVVITGRALQGRAAVPDDVKLDPGLCWLTPYAPWSAQGANKARFAQRNAFIAAMADVVIAVCGSERSGTRHTIEAALRFGRPVVSIATDVDDAALGAIADRLVATMTGTIVADDVSLSTLLELGRGVVAGALVDWQRGPDQPLLPLSLTSTTTATATATTDGVAPASPEALTPMQALLVDETAPPLVRLLAHRGALTIDDAAAALSTTVRELMVDIAELEMDGALRREGALLSLSSLSSAACKR